MLQNSRFALLNAGKESRNLKSHQIFYIFFWFLISYGSLAAQDIFTSEPNWISTALGHVATGLGVADINQDGWADIIVANGNDIHRQSLIVYYNDGSGSFPLAPSWSSEDIDYHGHLAAGDVNGDNLIDIAVSVFLGPGGFDEPGYVKIYLNTGNELEAVPSFQTADSLFTFSCALGDADGDGDLDLAVAGGQPYSIGTGPYLTNGRIYFNDNGSMQNLPGWQSEVEMGALDVDFADMDKNGFLDLIFASHLTPNYIFLADSTGQISTQPSWSSADNSLYANSLTVAEVDANVYPDLIVSDNFQLGGLGKFKTYFFSAPPQGESSPGWFSETGGFGSAVIAAELNGDDAIDLLSGRWWGEVELYPGFKNSFDINWSWASTSTSVIEAFVLRDVDKDGWEQLTDTLEVPADSIHTIYIPALNVEDIVAFTLNGDVLSAGENFYHIPGTAWISSKELIGSSDELVLTYIVSNDQDLVISNWDSNIGNYLFYNQTKTTAISDLSKIKTSPNYTVFPNPFNQTCKILLDVPYYAETDIKIYDVQGRLVVDLSRGGLQAGQHIFSWDGRDKTDFPVASGMYILHVQHGTTALNSKILLLR